MSDLSWPLTFSHYNFRITELGRSSDVDLLASQIQLLCCPDQLTLKYHPLGTYLLRFDHWYANQDFLSHFKSVEKSGWHNFFEILFLLLVTLFWNPGHTTLKSMGGQVVLVREIRFTLEQFCGPDSSVLEKWKDFFQRLFLDFDQLRSLNN